MASIEQIVYIAGNKNSAQDGVYRIGGCKTSLEKHINAYNKRNKFNKIEVYHHKKVASYQESKKELRRTLKKYKHSRKDEFTLEYEKLQTLFDKIIENRQSLAKLMEIPEIATGEPEDRVEIKHYKGSKQVSQNVIDIATLGEEAQKELVQRIIEGIKEESSEKIIVIDRKELEAKVKAEGFRVRSRLVWKQAKETVQKLTGVGLKW